MADTQVVITLKEEEYTDIKTGILTVYPNTSADDGMPVSDDSWALTRIPIIIGNVVRDGLRTKAVRDLNLAQQSQITPTVDAVLPDGTVISG